MISFLCPRRNHLHMYSLIILYLPLSLRFSCFTFIYVPTICPIQPFSSSFISDFVPLTLWVQHSSFSFVPPPFSIWAAKGYNKGEMTAVLWFYKQRGAGREGWVGGQMGQISRGKMSRKDGGNFQPELEEKATKRENSCVGQPCKQFSMINTNVYCLLVTSSGRSTYDR